MTQPNKEHQLKQRLEVVEGLIDERTEEVWQASGVEARKRFSVEEVRAIGRAMYGKGYHDALTEDLPGQLLLEAGYLPPFLADLLQDAGIELPAEEPSP